MTTILLVDDDKDEEDLFRDALQRVAPAISLAAAGDGIEALEWLENRGVPAMIFLDLNMPRLDGKQFLRTVGQHQAYSEVPIVIYTTSSNPEEKRITLQMGASYFMVKHYSFEALCEELRAILQRFLP